MTRKPWIRISAVVTVLAVCLSLPRLFPVFARASAEAEPYGFSESDMALGDSQQPTADNDSFPPDSQPPGEGGAPAHDPRQPGADGDDKTPEPDGAGDDTAWEEFYEGDTPPAGTDDDDEDPEGLGEKETEAPEEKPEEPLTLGVSGLTRSSRTVPGYNAFEVDSYAALAEALSATSYPSEEYPETNVYILLTGNVEIKQGFTLHPSIEKVTIDGDRQHTLSEINTGITYVSNRTAEVKFMDLTMIGYQYYGLFQNSHGTDVSYHYERVTYTGPQLLHAFNSTAHFTDCDIHITGAGAGTAVNEVAEIRDVFIHGNNEFRHNSPHSVLFLYNSGNLVLSHGAELRINAVGPNDYILFTADPQSMLRLEDRASLRIEGTSRQLAASAGLHSIYLGENAEFDWKAHRPDADYIAVNSFGGAKDAIYLSQGAAFRVASNGTPNRRLIRIDSGNVVVGPGASLSLHAVLYSASQAPFHLEAGGLTVGESATFTMQIGNRSELSSGLIYFGVRGGNGFSVDRDATVVIRGLRASAALHFSGSNSSVDITDPNYLEIAVTQGFPILFFNATALTPNTLTYTDVQQINYWPGGSYTYLNGGRYLQRWVAETEGFTLKATFPGNRNGNGLMEWTGPLDQQWTQTFDKNNFDMNEARILSVGRVGGEVSADENAYQGLITAPTMGVPYDQGAVQLRVGQPKKDRAVSPRAPAAPDFHVTPNQTVDVDDEIAVWAEYGYVFHNNPPSISAGTLSLTAPFQIEFGVVTIAQSDTAVSAVEPYSLQVYDPKKSGWQVMASFSGFSNANKSLNSTLVMNDIPLRDTPQRIAASAGNGTVPLDASLLVPGGTAEAGTYAGNITWTLVDAP